MIYSYVLLHKRLQKLKEEKKKCSVNILGLFVKQLWQGSVLSILSISNMKMQMKIFLNIQKPQNTISFVVYVSMILVSYTQNGVKCKGSIRTGLSKEFQHPLPGQSHVPQIKPAVPVMDTIQPRSSCLHVLQDQQPQVVSNASRSGKADVHRPWTKGLKGFEVKR